MDLPAKQKKRVAIENSLRIPTRGSGVIIILLKTFVLQNSLGTPLWKSGRGRRMDLVTFLLKKKFLKIPDLVHRPTAAPVAAGSCR